MNTPEGPPRTAIGGSWFGFSSPLECMGRQCAPMIHSGAMLLTWGFDRCDLRNQAKKADLDGDGPTLAEPASRLRYGFTRSQNVLEGQRVPGEAKRIAGITRQTARAIGGRRLPL